MMHHLSAQDDAQVVSDMVRWLERAVIGLNLCPFAKAVHVKKQIHYVVSRATTEGELMDDLKSELKALLACEASERDTTLLIAPHGFQDFLQFHDVTTRAERAVSRLGYDGALQLASFHPDFQFAGTDADDIGNHSNRAPYPTLHLLRESSIDRAVEAFPQAEMIFEKNIETLQALGHAGWEALDVGPHGKITP